MKLFLSVISAGLNNDRSYQLTLDKQGATLGRREDNTLVLPDTKRYISGHHAVITYRAPDYIITDTSANGVFINNSPTALGNGNSAKLNDGDLLQIGDYTIAVKLLKEAQQTSETRTGPLTEQGFGFSEDPFADITPDPIQRMIDKNELLPADWKNGTKRSPDPFADFPDLSNFEAEPVDERKSESERFEHVPAYKEAFDPFRKQTENRPEDIINPPPKTPPDFFDEAWDLDTKSSQKKYFPEQQRSSSTGEQLPTNEPLAPKGTPESRPEPPAATKTTRRFVAGAKFEEDSLLKNFLRGAELENSNCAAAINAESFYIIGKMLRASIQGAMEVLLGRAKIKNEMHLDVTVIRAKQNNPIKFSVSADEALAKLLTGQEKGYLPAEEAIREAFDDIRIHQYAVIAGMQTALLAVLKRFDPQKLEQRLQEISPIGASIPVHKQAKLWDLFAHLYQDIEREAEDNFYHLFGQAFAETYELQMQKLKKTKQDVLFD